MARATPWELIVATDGACVLQVTPEVNACVELSLNIPIAVNCWVVPTGAIAKCGLTNIPTRFGSTRSTVEQLNEPNCALIVVLPAACAAATPYWSTLAIAGAEDCHDTPV